MFETAIVGFKGFKTGEHLRGKRFSLNKEVSAFGESFFARQADFCGMGDPYDKLKRALRAEVDEGAWSMLYKTESILFVRPKDEKIAVKVINDYGDEVLKVYAV